MDWSTPQDFFDKLNEEFHFTLDPCADNLNHKCDKYYTERDDGLQQDWSGQRVFCNPPYGRAVSKWVSKCFNEVYSGKCRCAVMLLHARTDTRWFHDYIYKRAESRDQICEGQTEVWRTNTTCPIPINGGCV